LTYERRLSKRKFKKRVEKAQVELENACNHFPINVIEESIKKTEIAQ